jgi:hypothetical protein
MMRNQFTKSNSSSAQIQEEVDIPSQIRKLSALKDEGILTEEEFNTKKSELLNKM